MKALLREVSRLHTCKFAANRLPYGATSADAVALHFNEGVDDA